MKGAIPLSANSNTSGWKRRERREKVKEDNKMQRNRNMQRDEEEN